MQPLKKDPGGKDEALRMMEEARRVLQNESDSIAQLKERIDATFVEVVHRLDACKGHVVVLGIGKSGLIGQKIAATFSSIGLPALFLHAAEASHGDLGIIGKEDLLLAISNSGETEELVRLLPIINRRKCTLVAMTGRPDSTLAKRADFVLNIGVKEEACPLNLVPTSSTTATLAMGDALALVLLEKRGFRPEDFAQHHPGGSLGRRLLTTVEDLMHSGDEVPQVAEDANLPAIITEMSRKRFGTTLVVDAGGLLSGIITDGDLRRLMESGKDFQSIHARDLMSRTPKCVGKDHMATKAVQFMDEHSITCVVVSSDGRQIDGIIHLHDLLKAGVI